MELIVLSLIVLGLLGFTAYREYMYAKERQDMLDRLMSKDLTDLKVKQEEEGETVITEEKEDDDSFPLTSRPLSNEEREEVYGTN